MPGNASVRPLLADGLWLPKRRHGLIHPNGDRRTDNFDKGQGRGGRIDMTEVAPDLHSK